MAYEQKDGGGSLFPNDKKGNERAPDWSGTFLLGGEWYKIAGWYKDGRSGQFLSLKVEPKGQGTSQRIEREVQSKGFPDAKAGPLRKRAFDDEAPF